MSIKESRAKLLIIALVLIVLSVTVTLMIQYRVTTSQNIIEQGDEYYVAADPWTALKKYQEAQSHWPLLRLDSTFQSKLNETLNLKQTFESNAKLIIHLYATATDDEIQSLIKEIESTQLIEDVEFLTPNDLYLRFIESQLEDDLDIIDIINPNLFPRVLEVQMANWEDRMLIVELSENKDYVELVIQDFGGISAY